MSESPLYREEVREPQDATFRWLLRLRWVAVGGQTITVLAAPPLLGLRLPLAPMLLLIALTAISNLLAARWLANGQASRRRAAGLMMQDVLVMTALLALSGGASNPFTSFYLVQVTLAAVLLPAGWTWLVAALCTCCFGGLFLIGPDAAAGGHDHSSHGAAVVIPGHLHLQGMLVAFALTAVVIAYFVMRISELLRERERELGHARLFAAQNERFAALTTLAAGVAHELGSPLGTIAVASGELLHAARELPAGSAFTDDVELIRREVARCRQILDRMNRESTGGADEAPQPATAGQIVAEVKSQLRDADAARLRFTDASNGSTWRLPRALLAQAVANLVRNGCQASPASELVEMRIHDQSGALTLEVRDTGTGIPPEQLSRLGEPFFTTRPPGEGMGLGLFLVRLFAERVGGRLEFESERNRFTVARLHLPFKRA